VTVYPPSGQQLVDERGQAEDISPTIPRVAGRLLRRRVGASYRRGDAHSIERPGDPEPGQTCLFGGQKNVSRMQRPVADVDDRREIKRARQLGGNPQRVGRGRWTVFSDGEIHRLGGDVVVGQVRRRTRDPACQRLCNGRMRQLGRDELLETGYQLVNALGWKVQTEEFDRNQPLALSVISAKHGPKRPRTNLMKNPKRSERFWSRRAGSFRVQ